MLTNHPKVRLGIYLTGLGLATASAIVGVINPDLGAAFLTSSGVLTAAALGVAAANTPPTGGDA